MAMQEPGSVPGYFEEEAIKVSNSALSLSTLPVDQCQAYLALGRAQLGLYHLRAGGQQAALQLAWPDSADAANRDAEKTVMAPKVLFAVCMCHKPAQCSSYTGLQRGGKWIGRK